MVVIGEYHFWAWHPGDYIGLVRPPQHVRTVPMSDAMGTELHAVTIEREMTEWDWAFVMEGTSILALDARDEFRKAASKVVFYK